MALLTVLKGIVLKRPRDVKYIVAASRDKHEVEPVGPKLTGFFVPDDESPIDQAPFGLSPKCSISLERFDV